MSLFSILNHQNTKSTTVLCIYNILEEHRSNRSSSVSNFIGSEQKVAPYHLVNFQVMTQKVISF